SMPPPAAPSKSIVLRAAGWSEPSAPPRRPSSRSRPPSRPPGTRSRARGASSPSPPPNLRRREDLLPRPDRPFTTDRVGRSACFPPVSRAESLAFWSRGAFMSRLIARALSSGRLVLIGLALLLLPTFAHAAANSGAVRGKITDPDGKAVPGVVVQLRNDITGFHAEATTDGDGSFAFFNVPFNPYELHVEAKGFQTVHLPVDVRTSAPRDVNVALAVASLTEAVTV